MENGEISIYEWFDPNNVVHLRAYWNLIETGTWPTDFIPTNVFFPTMWQYQIAEKMAQCWVVNKLFINESIDKSFEKWYNANKNSFLLADKYDDYVTESKQDGMEFDSFEDWAKRLFMNKYEH